jgi:hypothetical protein
MFGFFGAAISAADAAKNSLRSTQPVYKNDERRPDSWRLSSPSQQAAHKLFCREYRNSGRSAGGHATHSVPGEKKAVSAAARNRLNLWVVPLALPGIPRQASHSFSCPGFPRDDAADLRLPNLARLLPDSRRLPRGPFHRPRPIVFPPRKRCFTSNRRWLQLYPFFCNFPPSPATR